MQAGVAMSGARGVDAFALLPVCVAALFLHVLFLRRNRCGFFLCVWAGGVSRDDERISKESLCIYMWVDIGLWECVGVV